MSDSPLTDAAELSNSHFSDWGTGPSGYVYRSDMEALETRLRAAEKCVEAARLLLSAFKALDEHPIDDCTKEFDCKLAEREAADAELRAALSTYDQECGKGAGS